MKTTITCAAALLFLATLSCLASAAGEDGILFKDTFSDLKGHVISQTDGKMKFSGGKARRRIFPFMGLAKDAMGELTIEALEDPETAGPDEKPGVLAIVYRRVPNKAVYSGFTYHGGVSQDRTITLKEITETPTPERLKRIKLTFKYRAANSINIEDTGASYNCRLEPNLSEPYGKRIGFGLIHATSKWKTFAATLDQGANIETFLKSVAAERPKGYRLVWGQSGLITEYQVGDTLLIDDVEIILLDSQSGVE